MTSRRMTDRKKKIIELLSIRDRDQLLYFCFDGGLFGFTVISREVFGVDDFHLNESQRVSLYRTLRGMVADGLLVTRKQMGDGTANSLPNWQTYWHLQGKLDYDVSILVEWEAGADKRQAEALNNFLNRL